MKRAIPAILILASAALVQAAWVNYKAPSFSMDFPTTPTTQEMNTPVQGVSVKTRTYSAQVNGSLCLVTCSELPSSVSSKDMGNFSKSYIDSFVRSAKATETSRKTIFIHGYSGQEARFKIGNKVGSVWSFPSGRIGYGIAVLSTAKDFEAMRSKAFNSFHAR